jgi:hypothetical protein
LLAARAEVNAKSGTGCESALYLAQKSEYEDVVKMLIEAGATGGEDTVEKLMLVDQNDPRCLVLANATTISGGQQAPLALAPPLQQYAICRAFEERREIFGEWQYTTLMLGPAAEAVTCALSDCKLVEGASQGVVTPSMFQMLVGKHFDLVWHKHNHPARLHQEGAKHGKGLDFAIHPNGTVSPVEAAHLCLGIGSVRPDCWDDDPPGLSAEGGSWAKFYSAPRFRTECKALQGLGVCICLRAKITVWRRQMLTCVARATFRFWKTGRKRTRFRCSSVRWSRRVTLR